MSECGSAFTMFSERGRVLMVYDGYKFWKSNNSNQGQKWRCVEKKCVAKLYVNETNDIMPVDDHNHQVSTILSRQVISNSLKRKAESELCERPTKLIRQEILSAPLNVQNEITRSDVACIKNNLYKMKRQQLPPLPKNLSDVHDALNSIPIISCKNEQLLQVNDPNTRIVIFSTKTNLNFLSRSDILFMDGTFSYCARFFTQMFTVHIVENGNYVPLVFALLPDKKKITYEAFFQDLCELCVKNGEQLSPTTIVVDFEQGIHSAIQCVWPTSTIRGCRFHLTQSWWRKIQSHGLTQDYKDKDSECGRWLRQIFGLSLLRPDEVEDCFLEDFMSVMPPKAEPFADYLVDTYIGGDSDFPPDVWASNELSSERTTNACEAFHSKFGSNFNSFHPNIFLFVEAIKNTQIDVYIALRSLHVERKIKDRKYLKSLEHLNQCKALYESKVLSRMEYVRRTSLHYKK